MRPHTILENMKLWEHVIDDLIEEKNENIVKLVTSILNRAVTFDFGVIIPTQDDLQFGLDLVEHDVFKAPFPIVHITSQHLVMGDASISFISQNLSALKFFQYVPVCFKNHKGVLTNLVKEELRGQNDQATYAIGLAYLAMLYRKEVEQNPIKHPDKQNILRQRKGKPWINDVIEIKIHKYTSQMAEEAAESMKRKSPCPHMVRGHVWRKRNGEVAWKAPFARACRNGEKPKPKNYVVKP